MTVTLIKDAVVLTMRSGSEDVICGDYGIRWPTQRYQCLRFGIRSQGNGRGNGSSRSPSRSWSDLSCSLPCLTPLANARSVMLWAPMRYLRLTLWIIFALVVFVAIVLTKGMPIRIW